MTIAKPKAYWPLTVDGTNDIMIVFSGGLDRTCTLAHATYYSAVTLAAAIQTAIRAVGGALSAITVSVSATGIITFTNGSAFTLRFTSAFFQFPAARIGFTAVADVASSGGVITSPNQHSGGWYAATAIRDDSLTIRDRSMTAKTRAESGQTKTIYSSELSARNLLFQYLTPEKTYIAYESTYVNQSIENLWADGADRFRFWSDGTVEGTYTDLVLDLETSRTFAPKRMFIKKALYEISLKCWGYVA